MVKQLHKQLGKVDFWNPDVGKWGAEILADYGCGYDKIFKYKVNTHWHGIGLDEKICSALTESNIPPQYTRT